MTEASRYRGIFTLDAMMSIIPTMLIFVFLMQSMSLAAHSEEERSRNQDIFERLVSVADYTVKSGLAKHEGDIRHPNWLDSEISADYVENIRQKAGFSELEISFAEPEGKTCIYRLVVRGPEKKLSKIYFCGE
jgi:hypothetical protein